MTTINTHMAFVSIFYNINPEFHDGKVGANNSNFSNINLQSNNSKSSANNSSFLY